MRFEDLELSNALLRAIQAAGYTEPTPIQEQAIPHVLAGRDLLGSAQTGTGKTAAFALPILHHLTTRHSKKRGRRIRALVLSPTRELATQIGENFQTYGRYTHLKYLTVYGGVSQKPQVEKLRRGVDVLIATPGRLLDLMNQGLVWLDRLEVLVLDEADRMLDMGFLPDVRRIIAELPTERQTLLFSATMPDKIQDLMRSILVDPVQVEIAPEKPTVEAIEQSVYFLEKTHKRELLEHLLATKSMFRTLVFTRTKHGANRLAQQLGRAKIKAEAIHGNKSQRAREQALTNFKRGKTQVLVATDIAARGIDVDDITHVINYDLPNETESYVHRIGRTGRAGAEGKALSFCSPAEFSHLADIERLIRMHIPVVSDHPYASKHTPKPTSFDARKKSAAGGSRNNNRRSGSRSRNSRNRNRNSSNRSRSQNRGQNQQRHSA
jgi:ATP-dependent RNA helicase RhlE